MVYADERNRKEQRMETRLLLRIAPARWGIRIVRSILGVRKKVGSRGMRSVIVLVLRGLVCRSTRLVGRIKDL
jgi:hypothetical protein